MLIMRGKQCRLGKSMSDECMGRWSHTCMRIKSVAGSGKRSLHFISLYRATKTINGPAAAYVQQQRIMLRQGRVETPEEALKKDVGNLLWMIHSNGDLVVISGDMNCASRHSFIQDMILKHGLRDAMLVHNATPPPTSNPGSKTIEFIMLSA